MALTKQQKSEIVDDVVSHLEAANTVYLTNYSGLSVENSNELRRKFRASNVQFRVVKNTLLRRAMEQLGGYDELFDHLEGPTAVAFSEEPAAPARVIKDFSEGPGDGLPALKGAYIDGAIYGADALETLSKLKSKDELIGDILGLLMAPMANVIGALQGPSGNLMGAIKTIADKEEEA